MKVHHTLICLFLSLQDGNTGLTDAEQLYTRTEGENITVPCLFLFHGEKKLFCRNECEGDDKLIETKEDNYQRGRYRIEYDRGHWTEEATLSVSITNLIKSDSGLYGCGLERLGPDGYDTFNLRVTDAPTPSGPNPTPTPSGPNPTPTPSGPNPTPTPLSISLPSAASPQTAGSSAPSSPAGSVSGPGYFLVVVVCVSVLVVVVLVAVVVLLLLYNQKMKDCGSRWRGNTEHTNMEFISNEYVSPPSTCEDSTYQSLGPASRDQDQIYSTLK